VIYARLAVVVDDMTPSDLAAQQAQLTRGSIALVGTLVARSFGLAAGVALALLAAALLWVP
jgi:hypothetical protein